MKITVTGASGQTGSYLVDYLKSQDHRIMAVGRTGITEYEGSYQANFSFGGNITEATEIDFIKNYRPDYCIHLAAQTSAGASMSMESETFRTNYWFVANLLEALYVCNPLCRFFNAGSCYEFGAVKTPYSVSKQLAREVVRHYRRKRGMFAIQGTLFPHTSVRQSSRFVVSKITKRVADIVHSMITGQPFYPLSIGNFRAVMYLAGATDIARGIWQMINESQPYDYELCGHETVKVGSIIEMAFMTLGYIIELVDGNRDDETVYEYKGIPVVIYDKSLDRPSPLIKPNLLDALPGWEPQLSVSQLVKEMTLFHYNSLTN